MRLLLKIIFISIQLLGMALGAEPQYRVLIVSAEQSGVLETGGLAIATADLAKELNKAGIQTEILMPGYNQMRKGILETLKPTEKSYTVGLDRESGKMLRSEKFSLHVKDNSPVRTFFLKHENKSGQINYFENIVEGSRATYAPKELEKESFGAFDKAAAQFIMDQQGSKTPYTHIIINDWHTGLIAPFLQDERAAGKTTPRIISAIHNMTYQGQAPGALVEKLGINRSYFHSDGLEFYGDINMLKSGIEYSDAAYTVSPTYAEEIATPRYGRGLQGVIQKKRDQFFRITGILNGIDNDKWDPTRLEEPFSANDLSGKAKGKAKLQKQLGFSVKKDTPMIALTSRITDQKGYDYLPGALEDIFKTRDVQIIQTTGGGDPKYMKKLERLAKLYPDKFKLIPWSEEFELMATGYADFFLNASWFEPSGLNQFFAMRMGTVPLVSKTGGLKDSVKNGVTGFHFDIKAKKDNPEATNNAQAGKAVRKTVNEALDLYERDPETLKKMRVAAMAENNSWKNRISEFVALFKYVDNEGPVALSQARPKNSATLRTPTELLNAALTIKGQCVSEHLKY